MGPLSIGDVAQDQRPPQVVAAAIAQRGGVHVQPAGAVSVRGHLELGARRRAGARADQHRPAREDLRRSPADGVARLDPQPMLERGVGVDDPPVAVAGDDAVAQAGDQGVARERRQVEQPGTEQSVGDDQIGDAEDQGRRIPLAEHPDLERQRDDRRQRRQRQADEDEQQLAQLRHVLADDPSHQQRGGGGDGEKPVGRQRPVEPGEGVLERRQRKIVADEGARMHPLRRDDLHDQHRRRDRQQDPPERAARRGQVGVDDREPQAARGDAQARDPLQIVEQQLVIQRWRQQLADVERGPDRVGQGDRREGHRRRDPSPAREGGHRRHRRHGGRYHEREDPRQLRCGHESGRPAALQRGVTAFAPHPARPVSAQATAEQARNDTNGARGISNRISVRSAGTPAGHRRIPSRPMVNGSVGDRLSAHERRAW